jgi:antitoxin HigA-1
MVILREEIENGLVDLSDEGDELLPPIHPGEHVRDWLEQTGVTAYALAKAMRVPQTRIAEILAGRRGITVDTAVRLGRAIGTSAEIVGRPADELRAGARAPEPRRRGRRADRGLRR